MPVVPDTTKFSNCLCVLREAMKVLGLTDGYQRPLGWVSTNTILPNLLRTGLRTYMVRFGATYIARLVLRLVIYMQEDAEKVSHHRPANRRNKILSRQFRNAGPMWSEFRRGHR